MQRGSAIVSGFRLDKLQRREIPYLRRRIGVVFQDFQLLSDRSVYDNLYFVLMATGWKNKREADAVIKERLESVGMLLKSHKMPHQLSGGEQQRVAICRALINDPELLLADEPTGQLDSRTAEEIMSVLTRTNERGKTVVVITHDADIAAYARRTIHIRDGIIKE